MSARRWILLASAAALVPLTARRAHALRDPSSLSAGGSFGANDGHVTCGPDVRVRHASGGLHYQRVFEGDPTHAPGEGAAIDLRAGGGSTKLVDVDTQNDDAEVQTKALALKNGELGRAHYLGAAQFSAGWDWGNFSLLGGLGYYGIASSENGNAFHAKYLPLPALHMRIGKPKGLGLELGAGAPPIAGLTRFYSIYALGKYGFKEGGEVGVGLLVLGVGDFDNRGGVLFKGGFPLTDWMSVGGYGLVDSTTRSHFDSTLNWTAGGHVTFVLDGMD